MLGEEIMSDRINQAIQLIKSGNKQEAFSILQEVIQDEPRNETAWLLLSVCVESVLQKRHFLQKVLEINPTNLNAINELQKLPAQIPPNPEPIPTPPSPSPVIQQQNVLQSLQSQSQNSYLVQQPTSASQQLSCPHCHGYKLEKVIWVDKRTGKEIKKRLGCFPSLLIIILTCVWFWFAQFIVMVMISPFVEGTSGIIQLICLPIWLIPYLPFLYYVGLDAYRIIRSKTANKVEQYTCGICGRMWRADGLSIRLKR